jgi:hypothetical protein
VFAQINQFNPNQNNGGFGNQQLRPPGNNTFNLPPQQANITMLPNPNNGSTFPPLQPPQPGNNTIFPNPNNGSFSNQPQQGCNNTTVSPLYGYSQYQSPNFGFAIQYPANSQVNETRNGQVVKFDFRAGVMFVLVQRGVGNMGLSSYAQYNIDNLTPDFPSAQTGDSGEGCLAGHPSHYLIFTSTHGVHVEFLWVIVGDAGYELGFFFNPDTPLSLIHDVVHTGITSFQVGSPQQPSTPFSIQPPQQQGNNTIFPNHTNGTLNPQPPQSGNNESAGLSSDYLQYQSPNLGFFIEYPADSWITEKQQSVEFRFSGGIMAVRVQDVSNMGGLAGYTQYVTNILSQVFPASTNVTSGDTSLAGYPGHYFIFFTPNGVPMRMSWIVVGNTGYLLTFVFKGNDSSDFVRNVVSTVDHSFQISSPPQQQPAFSNQQPLQPGFMNCNATSC